MPGAVKPFGKTGNRGSIAVSPAWTVRAGVQLGETPAHDGNRAARPAEVIVTGVPDEYRRQSSGAFVQGDILDEDTPEFLLPRLNRIGIPSAIEFRDGLPKIMVGKLSKKEPVAEEAARRAT